MKKGCGQVSIPTVNNDSLECDFFTSSKCVMIDNDSVFFKTINNHPTLYQFVETLEKYLKNTDKKYVALKVQNDKYASEIKNLQNEVNNLKFRVKNLQQDILIIKNNNNNVQ